MRPTQRQLDAWRPYREPLFGRIIASVITVSVLIPASILWHDHGYKLIIHLLAYQDLFVFEEDKSGPIFEKIEAALPTLLVCSILFLVKGVIRPNTGRKGSAQREFNAILNIVLSTITAVSASIASGLITIKVVVLAVLFFISGMLVRTLVDHMRRRA